MQGTVLHLNHQMVYKVRQRTLPDKEKNSSFNTHDSMHAALSTAMCVHILIGIHTVCAASAVCCCHINNKYVYIRTYNIIYLVP